MRPLALAVALLAVPAFAHHHDDDDRSAAPAVVDRQAVSDKLSEVDDILEDALAKVRGKPAAAQAIRHARQELNELQDRLSESPTPRDWWQSQQQGGQPAHDGDMAPPPPPPYAQGPGQYQAQPAYAQGPGQYQTPPPPGQVQQPYPMSPQELGQLLSAVEHEQFPQNRLSLLGQAAGTRYFLTSQVRAVLERFQFPRDRLAAVQILKPHLLDPQNGYQLYSMFDFPNDKAELQRILAQQ